MNFLLRGATDDRWFAGILAGALLIKLALAAAIPLTGDESYFVLYARHVDWGGFYDHPPMVGWLLWLMERLGSHPLVLRLPAVLTGLLLALGLYVALRDIDEARARLVALLMLLTPVYLIGVLITSDTGLILFGVASVLVLQQAVNRNRNGLFVLAGVLLGLAFLSKYFAVLLGLAYVAWMLAFARHQWPGFALLFLAVLPFGLWNIAWNILHCWDHVMFNMINRHQGAGFAPGGSIGYVLMLLYLLSLPLWHLIRQRHTVWQGLREHRRLLLAVTGTLPLLVFGLLSPWREIGLHWLLLFVPMVLACCMFLPRPALEQNIRFMGWFAAAHLLVVIGLLWLPTDAWREHPARGDIVFHLEPDAVGEVLAAFEGDFYATDSYSRSAILGYYTPHYWRVFGPGSRHGRQDDRITDWREHDGERMVFFSRRGEVRHEALAPYFDAVQVHTVEVAGTRYEVAVAESFDYAAYRQQVLTRIAERYYNIPDFLPLCACSFLARYGGDNGQNP